MATMKVCAGCKSSKPVVAFGVDRKRRDGCNPYCKICLRAMNLTRHVEDPEKARRRSRRWAKAHPRSHRKWYEANRELACQRSRARYAANREEANARSIRWYREHREEVRAAERRKRAEDPANTWERRNRGRNAKNRRSWRAANPEKVQAQKERARVARKAKPQSPEDVEKARARVRAWAKANPEKARALGRQTSLARRAKKRGAFREYVNPAVVYALGRGICGICSEAIGPEERWHIDHVVPLSLGGEHAYRNVQLAHAFCNRRKGAKMPTEAGRI